MRLLLDTHALLWWFAGDDRLSMSARRAIETGGEVLISAVSGWEVATKFRIGKLPTAAPLMERFTELLSDAGFQQLPLTFPHAIRAVSLPGPHQDPFDRMLIAQAQLEHVPLVSNETVFEVYGIRRIW